MFSRTARGILYTVLLFLITGGRAVCAGGGCFSPADIQKLAYLSDPAFSPGGDWVAYVLHVPPDTVRGEKLYDSEVWVVDFEGKRGPRRFAFGPGREKAPAWSPGGRWLAFLSDRETSGTDQVYKIRLDGGEAVKVTDFEEGVGSFVWNPGGNLFAVVVREPLPERVKGEKERGDDEVVIGGEDRFDRLWLVDSSTGKGEIASPDSLHVQAIAWSPDGSRIAMIVSDRPASDEMYWHARLEVLDISNGNRIVLSERAGGVPDWSPDGTAITFTYTLVHSDVTVGVPVVAVVGADGGKLRLFGRNLRSTLRYPVWHPDGEHLVVLEMAGVTARLAYLSLEDGKIEQVEELKVPYYRGPFFAISRDGNRLAYFKGSAQSPPDLWLKERGLFGKNDRVTDVNPWLSELDLPRAQRVRWTSRDGTEIEGVLFTPPRFKKDGKAPAVLLIHGGPMWAWWLGWHGSWHEWAVPLACRGFVVLCPNPRGSLGYGIGFARANFDDWGGGDLEDIFAGADFLVNGGYADRSRIGIGGWSYGGYMTSWAITQTRRFAAAVVGAGVTNLLSFHGTTDVTPTFLSRYLRDIPYVRLEAYRNRSAVSFVAQARTPTLILHGGDDARVPVGQAYELYNGLRQVGVHVEMVAYPREGHGFREIYHQVDLVGRVVDWFEHHLK